jgi:hypothetical protein
MIKTWKFFEGIHKIPQTGGAGSQFFPNWGRDKKEWDENSTQEQKRRPN